MEARTCGRTVVPAPVETRYLLNLSEDEARRLLWLALESCERWEIAQRLIDALRSTGVEPKAPGEVPA